VSYINVSGTFYYLCSILDGCSRYVVNWDLRESMTEADIEIILQPAKGEVPGGAAPDHLRQRPQFIAKDFKRFIRISGMTTSEPRRPIPNPRHDLRKHTSGKRRMLGGLVTSSE
jgi:transposase InsO family protein